MAPFGRDSLIVSLQNILVYPEFARGALEVLGALQAQEEDSYRDAEAGNILHEMRNGELAHFKLVPHTPYYGTADATPLYLVGRVSNEVKPRHLMALFVAVMAAAALLVTVPLAFEGAVWAAAYRVVGTLPDNRSAMLYSLSAITGYGHAQTFLDPHWQMMGALEALNGIILFGLTTALMFGMIQAVWPIGSQVHGRRE